MWSNQFLVFSKQMIFCHMFATALALRMPHNEFLHIMIWLFPLRFQFLFFFSKQMIFGRAFATEFALRMSHNEFLYAEINSVYN